MRSEQLRITSFQPSLHPSEVEQRWLQAAEAALSLADRSLLEALCAAMRDAYPDHLDACYYEARLALAVDDVEEAHALLESIVQRDPEHWPARWALGVTLLAGGEMAVGAARCREAAGGGSTLHRPAPRSDEEQRLWEGALAALQESYAIAPPPDDEPLRALHAVYMLEKWWRANEQERAYRFAQEVHERFPALVKPRLLLAKSLLAEGAQAQGKQMLDEVQQADPARRVAARLGYSTLTLLRPAAPSLAVTELLHHLPLAVQRVVERGNVWQAPAPLPAPTVVSKGRARSKRSKRNNKEEQSLQLQDIQQELERLRARVHRQAASAAPDLAPMEVVVAAREPLRRLYGEEVAAEIIAQLGSLANTISAGGTVRSHLILVDDASTLTQWGVRAAETVNAGTVKATLDQMEERLATTGERLAYVLLIGGHEIIPHHRLPNPVGDHDMDVPSDNPYAVRGDNYLIPTRAVGRLPHEHGSPDLLLGQIRMLQEVWRDHVLSGRGLWDDLWSTLSNWLPPRRPLSLHESLGVSAQVWAKAAEAVFRTLDGQAPLTLCPPITAEAWERNPLPVHPFYYFNLHGVDHNASWYGQVERNSMVPTAEPFPVALTPEHLKHLSLKHTLIFTEACYGAKPFVYDAGNSIALTAMKQGCSLFIGSTNTSYASFAPPLMAADLLAAYFWRAVAEGTPAGLALQRAKVELAETIMRRTGFLDVEEQKTLTSFILYGDPAFPLLQRPRRADPEALRQLAAKTSRHSIYQIGAKEVPSQALNPSLLEAVQRFAQPYLLGTRDSLTLHARALSLTDAAPRLHDRRQRPRAKNAPYADEEQWHVVIKNQEEQAGIVHEQVLTMLVNLQGKVLRTHTSR